VIDIEMNSVNDNPLLFPADGVHLEGGNFHGQPVALAADFLAIAVSELANISERRTERLVNGSLSGLPRFLTEKGGLHSGMMIAQYTAASLVSENKVLSHPASVDSIPTSANQEDHNSMGSIAAQKAWKVVENAEAVIAIEYLCACQALDFARTLGSGRPIRAGKGTEAAYRLLRSNVTALGNDRVLHADVQRVLALIRREDTVEIIERASGAIV
jgi:histidine ammonia-lyase